MKSFWLSMFCFSLLNINLLLLGYVFLKKKLVWQSWLLMTLSLLCCYFIFLKEAAVWRMLGLILTAFMGMKVLAAIESYKDRAVNMGFIQWLFFALAWAGMRAGPFETLGAKPLAGAWPMIKFGFSRLVMGALLVLLSNILFTYLEYSCLGYVFVIGTLLTGLSLVLHFGILSISAGIWRLFGVPAHYLFKPPAKSLSVTEFWGKRWNIAFSEMTSLTVFRPLKSLFGKETALMCAFLFSGLLHELALSIPVGRGYGLPLCYFLIQGGIVWIEKVQKISGRAWTALWIILPLPLLFHGYFIHEILLPILSWNI